MIRFKFQRYAALVLEKMVGVKGISPFLCDDVTVEIRDIPNVPTKVILVATTYFNAEAINGLWDDQLREPRALAEQAITIASDLLAIASCGGRKIESCVPHFGVFWPNNTSPVLGDEWTITKLPVNIESAGNRYVDISNLIHATPDRLNGISLLSLALSNTNGLGKFTGLCRFFEDAFALGVRQLGKKLWQFLSGNSLELGYRRAEIDEWFSYRDAASHGDLAISTKHVLEPDVLRFLPRMQQAAYDVLLNKKVWHASSRERRDCGRPSIMFREDPIHIFATVGSPVDYSYNLVDPFCKWPIAKDCKVELQGDVVYPEMNVKFPTTFDIRSAR